MKNIVPFIIIGLVVLSGLGAATFSQPTQEHLMKTHTISFSYPKIQTTEGGYAIVNTQNTNSWLYHTSAPMLPVSVTTYTFPFGTNIQEVEVSFSELEELTLEQRLIQTPSPVSIVGDRTLTLRDEEESIGALYPEQPFEYHVRAGILDENHVLFLTIRCYPLQYNSLKNTILYRDAAHISILYDLPTSEAVATDNYTLLILAPEEFSEVLQPLVTHKISKGMSTKLVTRPEICDSVYFPAEGRDCAEEMKYFIKNAFDNWGTRYVLLVGGRYGGVLTEKWWVPVRYAHVDDGAAWEGGYLSDLYFADLYDEEGHFSSWDPNNNSIFAEWTESTHEKIDMVPEVYLGRLACKNVNEVETVVNKIITYESSGIADKPWFNRMVVVGGDSAPETGDPYYEGEEENKLALQYMSNCTGVRLWTSNGNFTGPSDVIDGISAGCGFLFFDGHGNPASWSTHPPNDNQTWINGLQVKHMRSLTNGEKLPITVCGACHNGQFNTSLMNILKGVIQEGLQYFNWKFYLVEWIPACWAWKLVSIKNGGSIATMAYTGLDWFATGDYNSDSIPDCTQFFSGYANTQFFKNCGVNNVRYLGQAHTQALIDYLTIYPPTGEKIDCKTVQEFALLGDPSLYIGGYS
jgi:hypothetical protein